jgi:tetratricopeptide (TPR) repeat protein
VIDFTAEAALAKIRETAAQGRWAEAMAAADEKLGRSLEPSGVAAAGMLHFCNGDARGARQRFTQSLSMDPEDHQARLMLALLDWQAGSKNETPYHRELAAADWRSPAEFQGYLLQVLEGRVELPAALDAWTSSAEKSWLHYIGGLVRQRQGDPVEAERLVEQAVLSADPEGWEFLPARARLEEMRKQRRAALQAPDQWAAYTAHTLQFDRRVKESLDGRKKRQEALAPLWALLADNDADAEDKAAALVRLVELDPENRAIRGILAYAAAGADAFPEALEHLRAYLAVEGRQTGMRMGLGLLEAGILRHQGDEAAAGECLARYAREIRDPWFLAVCDYLGGRLSEDALRRQAGDGPENVLTAFSAAGFWAEGAKDKKSAIRFYREALGSFLDHWVEYEFVRERVKRLKRAGD